ncbi:MAG TPA: IS1595 family transposase [Gemmatimonadaceae bacterium]|jgi:transposase-like protein
MEQQLNAPSNLREAIAYFADPDLALAFLVEMRWPDGVVCPHCEAREPLFLKTRRIWKCRECRKQFSVKVGTVFEDSPLGLDKWLPALWLLANAKNGISSYEIARSLGVTQKTAWFMLGRIRLAMQTMTFERFDGEVEVDESFIGGKAKNMHKKKLNRPPMKGTSVKGKTAVMGLLQRGPDGQSQIRASVVHSVKKHELDAKVRANVVPGATINTDALPSYNQLYTEYDHHTVDHQYEWVRVLPDGRKVHTNGLENFWSVLKRGLKGTYISVDPFHLFRYVAEQSFRFNLRSLTDAERFKRVAQQIVGKRLTYTALTGAKLATT